MNQENDYIAQARSLAPFVERVLEIENIEEEIAAIGNVNDGDVTRALDVVGIATIAAALINLAMWIGQIRAGYAMKGASKEDVINYLSQRVLYSLEVSEEAKEKIILKALEKL